MIFVTTGTCEPFDRLLEALDGLELDERLVVQHGESPVRPWGAECVAFLPFDELVEHLRAARVVVTHAGVGSILAALTHGKRPIVYPRLARYGDAVDDHQLELAERLGAEGLVTVVHEPDELRRLLQAPIAHAGGASIVPGHALVADLRAYVAARLAA
jgi:UDP-N-acetylglucosamine transferase subunit ALG13